MHYSSLKPTGVSEEHVFFFRTLVATSLHAGFFLGLLFYPEEEKEDRILYNM
jgi:hypothetical protein